MKKSLTLALVLLVLALIHYPAYAMLIGKPKPITDTVAQSKLIVAARLVRYTPDPTKEYEAKPRKGLNGQEVYVGIEAFYKFDSLKTPGRYSLKVLQTISGEPVPLLEVDLPYVFRTHYGRVSFKWEEGDTALLMLKKNPQGQWAPVDELLPFIPLSITATPSSPAPDKPPALDELVAPDNTPASRVISLMLASLSNPVLRKINTHLLRDSRSPLLVEGLAPYINDPTPKVQDNVLYAMAVNQQVSVIPRIATFAVAMRESGKNIEAIRALESFSTPEAIPYLHPLLFHPIKDLRFKAGLTLDKLADRSSIPYLLIALHDPQPGEFVAHNSFLRLLRLLDMWQIAQNADNFWPRKKELTRPLYAWWRDELSGKHSANSNDLASPTPQPMPKLSYLKPEAAVPLLNPLLFEKDITTRQQAMTALEKLADRSSVPYLLLATEDPDGPISYSAYKTLHRLIPDLGTPKSRKDFDARHEAAVQPLHIGWQDELLGMNSNNIPQLLVLLAEEAETAYKAYKKLHQLLPKMGVAKTKAEFLARQREEFIALSHWWSAEQMKKTPGIQAVKPVP